MSPTSSQVKQAKKKLTPVSPSKKRYRDSPKINDRLTWVCFLHVFYGIRNLKRGSRLSKREIKQG